MKFKTETNYDFFFADANGLKKKIKFKDIAYIECAGNYLLLAGDGLKVMIHRSMNSIQEMLSDSQFLRIHKSYIISIDHIDSIQGNKCIINMANKSIPIPIGVTFRKETLQKLGILCEE